MTLDTQVRSLIESAPDAQSRLEVMAIAPILQEVAATLPQTTYYICQNEIGEWIVTTLQHQKQPDLEIQVIYAFNRAEDVKNFDNGAMANSLAIEVPIVQLLFYLLAFSELDRVVFLTDSQNLDRGRDISRADLEAAIQKELGAINDSLPPDVC